MLFKIQDLDELNEAFMQLGIFSNNLCIDKQIVHYYGYHFLKQFIRDNLIRFVSNNGQCVVTRLVIVIMLKYMKVT